MAEPQPYSGPIFDVQAHAIKPSGYEAVAMEVLGKDESCPCLGLPGGAPLQVIGQFFADMISNGCHSGKITRDRQ
jgi:hypothetical protein